MEKPVEEYIRATFSFLRVLKESERSCTTLAAKEDGKLVVVREIYATGLPYKEVKAIEHPLFAKIFLTAEEDGRTWVVEEYIDGESLQELRRVAENDTSSLKSLGVENPGALANSLRRMWGKSE